MKAQFKYAFITGLPFRGAAFAFIFVMDAVFIALGSLGLLPFAAKVTAVSLGGVAIAAMMVFDIIIYSGRRRNLAHCLVLYQHE
jgi:hypothetical protein